MEDREVVAQREEDSEHYHEKAKGPDRGLSGKDEKQDDECGLSTDDVLKPELPPGGASEVYEGKARRKSPEQQEKTVHALTHVKDFLGVEREDVQYDRKGAVNKKDGRIGVEAQRSAVVFSLPCFLYVLGLGLYRPDLPVQGKKGYHKCDHDEDGGTSGQSQGRGEDDEKRSHIGTDTGSEAPGEVEGASRAK